MKGTEAVPIETDDVVMEWPYDTVVTDVSVETVCIEILRQPILATTPILLKMTAPETLQWFAGAFMMHLLWGVVAGSLVVGGLRPKTAAGLGGRVGALAALRSMEERQS